MKKIVFTFLFFSTLITSLNAQKLTIKNIFGADKDEFGEYDLYTQKKETDISDTTETTNIFAVGNRFQADYKSNFLDGRFRLDTLYKSTDEDEIPKYLMAPQGFIHFKPIEQVGFAVGNNFFNYFGIPSGYLAAADDTTKYAKLLTDSLGHEEYYTTGDFAIYGTSFASGITSNILWGKKNKNYLKAAAGSSLYTDFDETTEYAVDFGVNAGVKKLFDAGIAFHDVTHDSRKFGIFAGLNSVQNMILNAGFYYNFTSSDYLPEARVERNNIDKFKKQKTKYALGVSGGYLFEKAKLGIYADIISGLTNEYIDEISYYDDENVLIKEETATIVRGSTIVKYKDGKAKRTDGFTKNAIPFYSQIRLSYEPTENLTATFNAKVRTMIGDSSQSWITLYPKLSLGLPEKIGTLATGLRFDMNLTRYEGLSSFAVPFTYTYKFKKEF